MPDEFLVVGVTLPAGKWTAMCEFAGCLDFQISRGGWIQTITEFQLEAPYLSASQLPAFRKALGNLSKVCGVWLRKGCLDWSAQW